MAVAPVGASRASRAGWLAAQLLLGAGLARPAPGVVVVAVVGLLVLAALVRGARLIIAVFAVVVTSVAVSPQLWPWPALLAGVGFLVLARGRPTDGVGQPRGAQVLWTLGVGLLAAGAVTPLVLPATDSAPLAFPVQQPPVLVLAAVVVGAAVVNAAAEELLWRGAVVTLDRRLGLTTGTTVAAQAIGFGLAHLHGIPGGTIGVVAAGAFGAAMTWLRLRAGLRAAFLAHVLTDVVIFSIVAATAVYLPG